MQINGINPFNPQPIGSSTPAGKPGGTSQVGSPQAGENTFLNVLDSLNASQNTADTLLQQLAAGQDVDLHQVMIATEENDVNFRVAMAIRDKLVDAYREVMRMSV